PGPTSQHLAGSSRTFRPPSADLDAETLRDSAPQRSPRHSSASARIRRHGAQVFEWMAADLACHQAGATAIGGDVRRAMTQDYEAIDAVDCARYACESAPRPARSRF